MHVVGAVFSFYVLLTGAVFVMQRTLLYPAGRELPELARHAVQGIEAVTTRTADGLELSHWFLPPTAPDAPVIAIFHGNAGHLGERVPKFLSLADAGYGLLFAGYRGYGGNPGKPTEAHLTTDSRGLLEWLARQGFGPERTVLLGESLGTGIAVKMAAEGRGSAVILESPYSSIAAVAQKHYWYLPARWLILDKWNSVDHVQRISAPLLILHGTEDQTIPLRYAEALFDAAPEPKEMVVVPGATHVDLFDHPGVTERVIAFLRTRTPAARQARTAS